MSIVLQPSCCSSMLPWIDLFEFLSCVLLLAT